MTKSANQKLKILYLMKILMDETDENHGLSMPEIIDRLDEIGIKAERKSIYNDIELLREYGLDIITQRGSAAKYFIGSREFESTELTLLVDAVQSSKSITEKKSRMLIKKLETLSSKYEAGLLRSNIHVPGRIKMQNESIFYNVDAIQNAIAASRKLSFKYYDYDMDKNKVPRADGRIYITNPVGLAYMNEYYYMVAYSEHYSKFVNYRVDRMTNIKITDEQSSKIPGPMRFDIAEYCQRAFSMFGGEDIHVQLRVDKSIINPIIDRFGTGVMIQKVDDNTARVFTAITTSEVFFGWLTQFGTLIKIEKPKSLAAEYKKHLSAIIESY